MMDKMWLNRVRSLGVMLWISCHGQGNTSRQASGFGTMNPRIKVMSAGIVGGQMEIMNTG